MDHLHRALPPTRLDSGALNALLQRIKPAEPTSPQITGVRVKFAAFATAFSSLIRRKLAGASLPLVPLPNNGPAALPIMATVAPSLEGWSITSGEWQLVLLPDGSFGEVRYQDDQWQQRPLQDAFAPPAAVIQALNDALNKAEVRLKQATDNAIKIAADCDVMLRSIQAL